MAEAVVLKPLVWVASSRRDLSAMPESVHKKMGFALYLAQRGERHMDAKPLVGFGGAGVLEVISDHHGDAFRCIYTVRFEEAVYVLHAFQKKSTRGIKTQKTDIDLVDRRLREVVARRNARNSP